MKKRLLSATLAVVCAMGAYAASVGDYIYSTTARFKVTGENVVTNGDFSNNSAGWTAADGTGFNANAWQIATVDGKTAIQSQAQSTDAGAGLGNMWQLSTGTYVYSYWAKADEGITSSTTLFYASSDGATQDRVVSETVSIGTEWTQVVDTIMVESDTEYLVMSFTNIPSGTAFTDFEIYPVKEVYDIRIAERLFDYSERLASEPDLAAGADEFLGIIASIREMIQEPATSDDPSSMESLLIEFNNQYEIFMEAAGLEDITKNDYFNYIEDLTTFPKYNRGDVTDGQVIGGFKFYGGNWLHGDKNDFLNKQIQGTYENGAGTVVLYNTNMPAGKYFVSAEMRNAYCDKNYAYTYNLESTVKARIGSEEKELGTIVGEDYVKFYMIGEVKEGETFEAGFWWDGPATGSAFNIKNFEIRAFDNDVAGKVAHKTAWDTFKAQYDAAVNARKNIEALQADKVNYPWSRDSLQLSLNQWDPYFNAVATWVTADGEDAGVASTDELNDWAKYQGVEEYETDEDGNLTETRKTYQVVRGYQNAVNYVKAQNKPIADLADAIKDAETTRDDDMYSTGDKATFQTVINAAQAVLDDIQATTTDAKKEADVERINEELEKLAAAKEAFIESGTLAPVIDIDFSNDFTKDADDNYIIAGAKGQMFFGANANPDKTTHTTAFELGYGEGVCDGILRMGNNSSAATVTLDAADVPTDNDVLRIQFDYWGGKLNNSTPFIFSLLNASNQKVAGIEWKVSNWNFSAVNDFYYFVGEDADNGLDFCSYITWLGESNLSNAQICVDANKTSLDLIIDYKGKAMRGNMTNGTNGTCEGGYVSIPDIEDNKITTISFAATGGNADRRSWLDNLKVYKYASQAEGPIETGIVEVAPATVADGAVYTIGGVKVQNATKPGLYIINGKKVVVK